jgi:putative NIF3 family GTP cyclohydrolase 1 type 2
MDALELGACIIDAGHFNTEKIILPVLEKLLKAEFPEISVICSKMEADPFKTC